MVDLDLDLLEPKSFKVKLGGEIIDVNPPKLRTLINLMKVSSQAKNVDTPEKSVELLEDIQKALTPMIPALEKGVDLSYEQLTKLMEFVMTVATPEQVRQAKVVSSAEKKTIS